jgi:hypothetical protein
LAAHAALARNRVLKKNFAHLTSLTFKDIFICLPNSFYANILKLNRLYSEGEKMRILLRSILLYLVVISIAIFETGCIVTPSNSSQTYDVVIYGGTSAAVAAAVQTKRMGKTAIIVCPEKHLGGLTAGGLGWTDSGRKEAIGGISREFYQHIKKHYDKAEAWIYQKPLEYSRYRTEDDAMWVFEPHVAEQTFEELVAEHEIPVHRDQWLKRKSGVTKDGTRIVSITMLSGKTYRGRIFIDATYEGDLMAGADVSYYVGREGNDAYGETLNGVQTHNATKHQF